MDIAEWTAVQGGDSWQPENAAYCGDGCMTDVLSARGSED